MSKTTPAVILILCSALVLSLQPAQAKNFFDFFAIKHDQDVTSTDKAEIEHSPFVTGRIVIDASRQVVWDTIHDERKSAPDLIYSKVVSENQQTNESVIEQRWQAIPFFVRTRCTMSEVDTPMERIDFKLLTSDEFRVMQGAWLLKATEDGNTSLELNTHLLMRKRGPEKIVRLIAQRKIARRLAHIKHLAEAGNADLQVNGRVL